MFARIGFRKWHRLMSAMLGFGLFLGRAGAGPAPASEPPKPAPPWPHLSHDYIALPGQYWMLGRKQVRDEVGLTAAQTEKLTEIGRKFAEANRQATARIDWAKLSPDERRAKYGAMLSQNKKRTDEFSQQVRDVLTADQNTRFEAYDLRQQALQLLFFAPAADRLGLSEQQKEKLRKDRDEHHRKMSELQRQIQHLHDQSSKAALEMLTPKQVEKLKELRRTGFASRGPDGAPPGDAAVPEKK